MLCGFGVSLPVAFWVFVLWCWFVICDVMVCVLLCAWVCGWNRGCCALLSGLCWWFGFTLGCGFCASSFLLVCGIVLFRVDFRLAYLWLFELLVLGLSC